MHSKGRVGRVGVKPPRRPEIKGRNIAGREMIWHRLEDLPSRRCIDPISLREVSEESGDVKGG